jgi:DNA-binding protein YbaB
MLLKEIIMDEKIEAIQSEILSGMPDRNVQYQNAGGLNKFRMEGQGPTHWLYISEELVEDSESIILINLINIYSIVDTLNKANHSKWLYLETNGVREVDENFAKERPIE